MSEKPGPNLEPTLPRLPDNIAPTIARTPRAVRLPYTWTIGDKLPHSDDGSTSPPKEGAGVTMGCGSDSYPGTVVRISDNGKSIWVVGDDYQYVGPPKPYGDNGRDDDWDYIFRGGEGAEHTLRKDGRYHRAGTPLKYRDYVALGHRHYHYDFHR